MTIKPGAILIKDNLILTGLMFHTFDFRLIEIIGWLAITHGIYITEGYREKRHADDLHGTRPVRAIDCRERVYADAIEITKEINDRWTYDPERLHKKCCVLHDVGKGMHMHIQVHPRTRRTF